MALFTDVEVLTLDDLLQFEASLVPVASSHGINVATKINLTISNIGDRLLLWLISAGASDPQWITRRILGLSTVVVTPPLRRWLCFDALSRFFAEAYNVQLNTRFQGKWTEYQNEATNAATMFFMSGVGIVYSPLPKPAMPLVSVQTGSAQAEAIFLQTAWVDGLGNESAVSAINGQVLNGAASLAVSMAEGAINVPTAAAGWNLYASAVQNVLSRQNTSPLPIGSIWELPVSGLIAGEMALGGQTPNYYVALSRKLKRA